MITAAGLALGIMGAFTWPSMLGCVLMLLSLGCDAIDGATARALNATTPRGAMFDWWTDVSLVNLIAWRTAMAGVPILAGCMIAVAVACQFATAATGNVRMSGRCFATITAIVWWWLG